MKLYTYEVAPNPRRLKLFLDYKGVSLETQEIDIPAKEQFSDSFKAINPRCTLPALALDDGSCLADTISICLYLDSLYPDKPLLGSNPLEQAQVIGWCHQIFNDGFHSVAEVLRNKSEAFKGRAIAGAVDLEQIPELVDRGRKRIQGFFDGLEAHLAESAYIVGDRLTMADIDAFVTCDFAGWVKETIPEHCVNVQAWYQRVSQELGQN